MFKVNYKDTRRTFYCISSKLWTYSIPFSSVSTDLFEQVYVVWVPPYQFINAEIIYYCNH